MTIMWECGCAWGYACARAVHVGVGVDMCGGVGVGVDVGGRVRVHR